MSIFPNIYTFSKLYFLDFSSNLVPKGYVWLQENAGKEKNTIENHFLMFG